MIELLRTQDLALISALKAALADSDIPVFEFDAAWADTYVGIVPRRLMVADEDLEAALEVARAVCPEEIPGDGES